MGTVTRSSHVDESGQETRDEPVIARAMSAIGSGLRPSDREAATVARRLAGRRPVKSADAMLKRLMRRERGRVFGNDGRGDARATCP